MPLIHIFGASGAGTTTLGRAIAEQWDYVHLDTDDFFWLPTDPPYTDKRPMEERVALLLAAVDRSPRCVLTGSLCGWGDFLVPRFDLAIYLQTPTEVRIRRLRERESRHFGDRIQPGGDMYDNHREFLEWAATYDTAGVDSRSRALHDVWAAGLPCPVLPLDGMQEMPEQLRRIRVELRERPAESPAGSAM